MQTFQLPCHPKDRCTTGYGIYAARGIPEAPRGWFPEVMDRVLNNIILKDERQMSIICTVAKCWSKSVFAENSKELKKEKYYFGILMNF